MPDSRTNTQDRRCAIANMGRQECPLCTYASVPGPDNECVLCGGIVTLAEVDIFDSRQKDASRLLRTCTERMRLGYRAGDPEYFRGLGLAYLNLGNPTVALHQLYIARRCGSLDPHLERAIQTLEYRHKPRLC